MLARGPRLVGLLTL